MTFQWTAVAVFLYVEIAILLLLCIPYVSPLRWQKIFMFSLWDKIANYWNKAFLAIIVLLIVLFLDAVREVRKYSNVHLAEKSTQATASAYDHIQMKLFRSQRNLYISGFSLFLWLVLRRTVSLITLLAKEMGAQVALEIQVANTSDAARKYLEENEKLQQSLMERNCVNKELIEVTNKKLKQEAEQLKAEIKKSSMVLGKKTDAMTAVKNQAASLKKEYDYLMQEHKKLKGGEGEKYDKKAL
ncbi:B-cell receptor-associated protein 29-like [Eublepharis macularius]|uniref:Endoplasmic reticulum transmembrane protein n=1 Tax=Eublepharis macularius TaxID=481883 RepID=A0AA97JTX9_EUBMA|nr:B-cell receptor-associated protein 29-like [Eublepharis macularius]